MSNELKKYRNKETGEIVRARRWNKDMIGIDDGTYPEGYLYNEEFNQQYEEVPMTTKSLRERIIGWRSNYQFMNENPAYDEPVQIIDELLEVIEMQKDALTEISNWRDPDSGYWETSIPDALAGTAETALEKTKSILGD